MVIFLLFHWLCCHDADHLARVVMKTFKKKLHFLIGQQFCCGDCRSNKNRILKRFWTAMVIFLLFRWLCCHYADHLVRVVTVVRRTLSGWAPSRRTFSLTWRTPWPSCPRPPPLPPRQQPRSKPRRDQLAQVRPMTRQLEGYRYRILRPFCGIRATRSWCLGGKDNVLEKKEKMKRKKRGKKK